MKKTNLLTELKTKPNIEKRIFAGIIDYLIISIFFFIFLFYFGEPDAEGELAVSGLPVLIPILFWGIMTIGLEIGLGATLGNSLVGLKAIPINGTNRKLTFGESLKRHLLDQIDMFFFGLVGIITIKNTEKNQRIGDLWAKTIVVTNKSLTELKTE